MFELWSPVKHTGDGSIFINQGFAENFNNFYKDLGMLGHNGLDFNSTIRWHKGEGPVYAAHDGYVISDSRNQSDTAGRFVKLLTDEIEIDGLKCKVMTLYFHLKEAKVGNADPVDSPYFRYGRDLGKERYVERGVLIGTSDSTGKYTTGPHLHFGMYILWKKPDGTYQAPVSNGYDGSVDPIPYFKDSKIFVVGSGSMFHPNEWFYNGKPITRKEGQPIATKIRETYS